MELESFSQEELLMFIDKNGDIYQGDMQLGDREATEAEIETHEASIVTALKIAEAKNYLASTDFKMTVDYFALLTTVEQTEITSKRAEARNFLKECGL